MATKPKRNSTTQKFIDTTTDFSGGINRLVSPDKLRDNQFIELVNLDIDKVGQAVKRYGLKQFAVNNVSLHSIVCEELKKQYPSDINDTTLTGLKVYKSFHFYDGVRNTLHFVTNIGLIVVVFNEAFDDIEVCTKKQDNTVISTNKIVLYYKDIIEKVRYVNYNSQHLLYVSRPKTMVGTEKMPVQRPDNQYGQRDEFGSDVNDPQKNFITVDPTEPNTVYVWNPTNKNRNPIPQDKKEQFLTIQPLGWVQNFNFNAPETTCPDQDGTDIKPIGVQTTSFPNITKVNQYELHTTKPQQEGDVVLDLSLNDNYFLEPKGSFEYVEKNYKQERHTFVYNGVNGKCEIVIDDIKTLGETEFIPFPIIYYNSHFYFGGCTRTRMYFYELSLNQLNTSTLMHNPTPKRIINAKRLKFNRGENLNVVGGGGSITIDNCFELATDVIHLANPILGYGAPMEWWIKPNPAICTTFDLLKNYRPLGDRSCGRVVVSKTKSFSNQVPCLALPVYYTISTAGGALDHFQWKAVIVTDVLYDVTIDKHQYAIGYNDFVHYGAEGPAEMLLKNWKDKSIGELNQSFQFCFFYDAAEYFYEWCEDFSDYRGLYGHYKIPQIGDPDIVYLRRWTKGGDILQVFRKKTKIVEVSKASSPSSSPYKRKDYYVKSYFCDPSGNEYLKGAVWVRDVELREQQLKGQTFVVWAVNPINNAMESAFGRLSLDQYSVTTSTTDEFGMSIPTITRTPTATQNLNLSIYRRTMVSAYCFPDVYDLSNSDNNTSLLKRPVGIDVCRTSIHGEVSTIDYKPVEVYDPFTTHKNFIMSYRFDGNNKIVRNDYGNIEPVFDNNVANQVVVDHTKDLPIMDYNFLDTPTKKFNYLGHGFLKYIAKVNQNFGLKLWVPFLKQYQYNQTLANTIDQFIINQRLLNENILNNNGLSPNSWNKIFEFIRQDLTERIQSGNLTGVDLSSVSSLVNEWYNNFGMHLNIYLVNTNLPFSYSTLTRHKVEALNISNLNCFYNEYDITVQPSNWNQSELKEFINGLDTAFYLELQYRVNGTNLFNYDINRAITKNFLQRYIGTHTINKPMFKMIKYGTNGRYIGSEVYWDLSNLNQWEKLFGTNYLTQADQLKAINQSTNNIGISIGALDGIKVSENLVTFKPIREYIPTVADVKQSSFNLLNLDDRSGANDNRKSDNTNWTNISRWLVREIKEGDASVNTKASEFYLSGILPVNSLTLNPLVDLRFKLYAYVPTAKPKIVYRWISMSVEEYNSLFFDDKYDWRSWFSEGTVADISSTTPLEFWTNHTKVPYGDREWIIGWAVIRVDSSFSSTDLGDLNSPDEKVRNPARKKILSASPLFATQTFVPNSTTKEGMLKKSFYEFLNTDKATTFAGRVVLYGDSNKLFFSELNNPTYFPLFNTIELPTQEKILSCVEFGYYLIVSTENFKYILRGRSFDNSSSVSFTLDNISADTGSVSSQADVPNGNYLFFLDQTGVKALMNAYGTAEKEYKFKPVDELINSLLPSVNHKQNAISITHDNKFYIHFPYSNQIFVYYNDLMTWSLYTSPLMSFSQMYSDNGILYAVAKDSMNLYWFDKDTYVDGWTGLMGQWDESIYGPIWDYRPEDLSQLFGTFQQGTPIQTSLITRPVSGYDINQQKAFYDVTIDVSSNVPMNYLDLRLKLDSDKPISTWSMSDGVTNKHGMLYTHFLETSNQLINYYTRIFPQAILNQNAITNYSRLGYSELNTHRVKMFGRTGRDLTVGVRNKTPGSYSIDAINIEYKMRGTK